MRTLFDFDAIRALFASGFRMRFDAMHAITGPYAHAILEGELGSGAGTVVNGTPLPDFGGHHPDPNLTYAKDLYDLLMSPEAPDFGAASDGDGDRNLIIGRGLFVTPSDSLAMLAANAHLAPGYAKGLAGVARSMPTSAAADRVAAKLGIGGLRDADGLEVLRQSARCGPRDDVRRGEFGHRLQPHPREGRPLGGAALAQHSRRAPHLGRRSRARALADLRAQLLHPSRLRRGRPRRRQRPDGRACARSFASLPGQKFGALTVEAADDFAYHDPVDGSDTKAQGIRVMFEGGSRIVYRLSGTGTVGRDAARLYRAL